jgi:hypothetical protein
MTMPMGCKPSNQLHDRDDTQRATHIALKPLETPSNG